MNTSIPFQQANDSVKRKFMTGVYGWMFVALLLSGVTAYLTATIIPLRNFIYGNSFVFLILIIAQLGLVFWLSAGLRKMQVTTAVFAFLGYSILNGFNMSSIFMLYTATSITRVFLITALMFGGMTLYGLFTKSDLRGAGRYLMMGLIGLIIAMLINFLFRSSTLDWIISIVTVVIFTGLTAYDTQKLLSVSKYSDGSDTFKKVAIIGALELYIDFINIFLSLLRLFGRRN